MENVTVKTILSETLNAFQTLGARPYMWATALIIAGVASDITPEVFTVPATLGFTVLSLFAQSDIVRGHLANANLLPPELKRQSKIWSLFLLGLLYALAVIFGTILLVLPGIFIAVRWWLASPILYADDVDATEALGRSWDISKDQFQPILSAAIVLALPYFAALAGIFYAIDEYGNINVLHSIPFNIVLSFATIALWLSSSATYSLIKGDAKRLNQIFE